MDETTLENRVIKSLEEGYSTQEILTALKQDGYSDATIRKVMSDVKTDLEKDRNTGADSEKEKGIQKSKESISKSRDSVASSQNKRTGKIRNPVLVLIFSFLSLGIYIFYWEYQIIKQLLYGKENSHIIRYLLTWIPLINLFIYWKICGDIEDYSGGKHSQGVLMLLWIFFFPVAIYITQKDLNEGFELRE